MGLMCPEGTGDCLYDTFVNGVAKIMGYDYIGNIVGNDALANSGVTGNGEILSALFSTLGATIIVLLLFTTMIGAFARLYRMGKSGKPTEEESNNNKWSLIHSLLAVVLVAPVGKYPLVVYLITVTALLGNGLANQAMDNIVTKQIDSYSMTDVFNNPLNDGSVNVANTGDNRVASEQTTAGVRLFDTNNLQKYVVYGALHGACVGKMKQDGFAVSPLVKSATGVYKDGRINLSYHNAQDLNSKSGIFGGLARFLSGGSDGREAGLESAICGTVNFDFFTANEFEQQFGAFVGLNEVQDKSTSTTRSLMGAIFGEDSEASADQSVRTQKIQESVNTLMRYSSGASSQINNLRTSYAVDAYLTGFMHAGGKEAVAECNAISEMLKSQVENQFVNADNPRWVEKRPYLRSVREAFTFSSPSAGIQALTTGKDISQVITTRRVDAGFIENDKKISSSVAVTKGSPCTVQRSVGEAWQVSFDNEKTDENGNTIAGKIRFFDSQGLLAMATALEKNLFLEQKAVYTTGVFDNKSIRSVISKAEKDLKDDYKSYLVARGWIHIAEGTVLLRNLNNSISRLYFLPSGSANIALNRPDNDEEKEVSRMAQDYYRTDSALGTYYSEAMSAVGSSGAGVHYSLRTQFNLANTRQNDQMMTNVADGIIDAGFINDLEVSILNTMTEDKLKDDPIGAMVSMGHSARLTAIALEILTSDVASVSMDAAKVGAMLHGNALLGAVLSIADSVMDMVRPSLTELQSALERTGYFLGSVVPMTPSLMMMYASITMFMSLFLTQVGTMLWLVLFANPQNNIVGNIQQLWVSLLNQLFRPVLLVFGFNISMMLLSIVVGLVFETWFISKTMITMEADNGISSALVKMATFKESFEHLGILLSGATLLCLSWVAEFADSVLSVLGTNLYSTFGNVSSERILGQFASKTQGLGSRGREERDRKRQSKQQAEQEQAKHDDITGRLDKLIGGGGNDGGGGGGSGGGGSQFSTITDGPAGFNTSSAIKSTTSPPANGAKKSAVATIGSALAGAVGGKVGAVASKIGDSKAVTATKTAISNGMGQVSNAGKTAYANMPNGALKSSVGAVFKATKAIETGVKTAMPAVGTAAKMAGYVGVQGATLAYGMATNLSNSANIMRRNHEKFWGKGPKPE